MLALRDDIQQAICSEDHEEATTMDKQPNVLCNV